MVEIRNVGRREVEIDIVEYSNVGETEVRLSLEDFNYIITRANHNTYQTTGGWYTISTSNQDTTNWFREYVQGTNYGT